MKLHNENLFSEDRKKSHKAKGKFILINIKGFATMDQNFKTDQLIFYANLILINLISVLQLISQGLAYFDELR